MDLRKHQGAIYLDGAALAPIRRKPTVRKFGQNFGKVTLKVAMVLLAFVVVSSSLNLTLLASTVLEASATAPDVGSIEDGEDDGTADVKKTLEESMEASGLDPEDPKQVAEFMNNHGSEDANSFKGLFKRIFMPSYINYAPNAYVPNGQDLDFGCKVSESAKGTIGYHNCDVPNLSAEFVQDIARFLIPWGAYNANQESAVAANRVFGYPPKAVLPGNGDVPVQESSRSYKYTGLELFGYNLSYTAYNGEWDYIKVMTSARTMANFGTFDKIAMGGKAVIDGVAYAANELASDVSQGNIFGAISGLFGGYFEGAATESISTILDTSDYNVFNQLAWYRPDFGATTYGARSMSSEELAEESLRQLESFFNSFNPETYTLPEDFPKKGSNTPKRPLEAISSCYVMAGTSGELSRQWGNTTEAPGPTEGNCKSQGDSVRAALVNSLDADDEDDKKLIDKLNGMKTYEWDEDGVRAQQSIADWASSTGYPSRLDKYGFDCSLPSEGSAASRKSSIDAWYSCKDSQWQGRYDATMEAGKKKENNKYFEAMFGKLASKFVGWFSSQNQDKNFNAAYNRFVCVDSTTGKDMRDANGNLLRVYNSKGDPTGNCGEIRSPIQNGLLGNGYLPTEQPQEDTRRTAFDPFGSFATVGVLTVADASLGIASAMTQFSNTILGLAFTPILDALDLRDTIVGLIESFRDSMFFPLAGLVAALGAFTILFRALRSNAYTEAFTSFLYILGAFILGVALLSKPAVVLKWVDEGPVMVENTILTALFNNDDSNDQLCTTNGSGYKGNGSGGKTITGNTGFDPNGSVRVLMCENWRSFVFTPWVYGQWGTSYQNLYANGATGLPAGAKTLSNTNGDLVGTASVNFGSNTIVKNWATYQLATQTIGTSTTADNSKVSGLTNKNWYRIVDAQMGPNNGAGTDSRYAESWSKANGDMVSAIFMAPVASVVGAVVVISYTIAKLTLVFTSIFLLVILPFMLLLGVHPTFGRQKLKAYGGTLISLMIQRILLTVLLGVLFKFLFSISAAATSYFLIALLTIIVSLVFFFYRKELLGLVQKAMDEAAGSFAGGRLHDVRQMVADHTPKGVKNALSLGAANAKGMAYGAAAGMAHGQNLKEMNKSLKDIRHNFSQRALGAQKNQGFAGSQKAQQIATKVERELNSKFAGNEYESARNRIEDEASTTTGFYSDGDGNEITDREYSKLTDEQKSNYVAIDKEVTTRVNIDRDRRSGGAVSDEIITSENGEATGAPVTREHRRGITGRKTSVGSSAAVRRSLQRQKDLEDKLARLESKKTRRLQKGETRALMAMGYKEVKGYDESGRAIEVAENTATMTPERRAAYEADRARVHMALVVAGNDGRLRRTAKDQAKVDRTSNKLDSEAQRIVDNEKLRPVEERRARREEAFVELSGLVTEAVKDAKEASDEHWKKKFERERQREQTREDRKFQKAVDRLDRDRGGKK